LAFHLVTPKQNQMILYFSALNNMEIKINPSKSHKYSECLGSLSKNFSAFQVILKYRILWFSLNLSFCECWWNKIHSSLHVRHYLVTFSVTKVVQSNRYVVMTSIATDKFWNPHWLFLLFNKKSTNHSPIVVMLYLFAFSEHDTDWYSYSLDIWLCLVIEWC
jgi:hypothetical protein